MAGFAHLHVHSHYTLLGSTASVVELANRAATIVFVPVMVLMGMTNIGGSNE
jgi:DNA polymerase III alpha subunit